MMNPSDNPNPLASAILGSDVSWSFRSEECSGLAFPVLSFFQDPAHIR
jgi:hypothetical protein